MIRPSSSETNDALTNHSIALPPIRPTALVSPICGVAHMRDADDPRGEHQRRDDHLDQAQENVGEQRDVAGDRFGDLRVGPQFVAGKADGDAENHADKDDHRQALRAHLPIPRASTVARVSYCRDLGSGETAFAINGPTARPAV